MESSRLVNDFIVKAILINIPLRIISVRVIVTVYMMMHMSVLIVYLNGTIHRSMDLNYTVSLEEAS